MLDAISSAVALPPVASRSFCYHLGLPSALCRALATKVALRWMASLYASVQAGLSKVYKA